MNNYGRQLTLATSSGLTLLTVKFHQRTDARVWWAARRVYPRKCPKTKKWPCDGAKHRQRVHPRKKDTRPDAKDKRCKRCEERRKKCIALRDACLTTNHEMYSSIAYHQKLGSKNLSGESTSGEFLPNHPPSTDFCKKEGGGGVIWKSLKFPIIEKKK